MEHQVVEIQNRTWENQQLPSLGLESTFAFLCAGPLHQGEREDWNDQDNGIRKLGIRDRRHTDYPIAKPLGP
jgi:hypothetical protein